MNKEEYLLESFKNKRYTSRKWVLSAFSVADIDEKIPGLVYRTPKYVYTLDNGSNEIRLECPVDKPVFDYREKVKVNIGLLDNIVELTETTYGNLLFNAVTLSYAFGNKFKYANSKKECSIKNIEAKLITRLGKDITVEEYLKFNEGIQYLTGFNVVFCTCVTPRLLLTPPNNNEVKKKLLENAGEKVKSPVILSRIQQELDKNDKLFLEGDNDKGFMNNKIKIARRKMFLMQGAEHGLVNKDEYDDVITGSLSEGLKPEHFTNINNTLRAGSLNRGIETQLGGVATKEFIRATNSISIIKGDCGTKEYKTIVVTEANYKKELPGFYLLEAGNLILVETEEQASKYIGKIIKRRSPLYCKSKGDTYCEVCSGSRLSKHPKGVSMAAIDIGGTMLNIFMSAMHAKEVKVNSLTIEEVLR